MSVNINTIQEAMESNKDTYLDLTHQLNNYNEIYNVNFYLKNMNTIEQDRLAAINQNVKSKVLRMKQDYMMMEYGVHEYRMRSNIMYATIVVTAIVFIIWGMVIRVPPALSQSSAVMYSLVIGVLYMALVIFLLMSNAKRRRYAWNQYYWADMKKSA